MGVATVEDWATPKRRMGVAWSGTGGRNASFERHIDEWAKPPIGVTMLPPGRLRLIASHWTGVERRTVPSNAPENAPRE